MARKDKSTIDDTKKSDDKGSRLVRLAKGSVLLTALTAILYTVGVIADFSSVFGIVGKIWPEQIRPMAGDINVVYVPFTSDHTVAEELVTIITESYGDELKQRLPQALGELTGDDSGYNVEVRVLEGLDLDSDSSSAERVRLYQRVMHDHNSDIVVSGHLTNVENAVNLESKIFINEDSLEGAVELAGIHYLDFRSTSVEPGRSAEGRRRIRANFVDQIESYVRFIAAISLYVYGDSRAAISGLERVRDEWQPLPQRKKVVDVFLGNAWGRLNDNTKAKLYYSDAIALDPSYARAHLGLAEIDYQVGHGGCQRDSVVYDVMERNALQYDAIFQAALGKSSDAQDIDAQDILERAAFGRGRANLCLALAMSNAVRHKRAQDDFSYVIDRSNGGKESLRQLATESHANRGLSLLSQGNGDSISIVQYMEAAEEYRAAISLARDDVRRGVFYGMLGFIESQSGGSSARSCYLMAKKLDPERAIEYDKALARLGESRFEAPCG